ncbi:hypothetical protein tb265_32220 [Gemmatimonadetes bacterium T265]|nr:hypothetical protein tb265_32220 [Gemmatimonadetes bacterium T265]
MSTRYPRPRDRGPAAPSSAAVIAKGPQAAPPSAYAPAAYLPPAPNAALLIDFDNVTLGIQKDLQAELRALLSSDIIRGKVSVQRAYADWRRYPNYVVPLTANSIDIIFAVAGGTTKKNSTDIRLAIDAMELVFTRPEIGTFILLSGDSDFSSLVLKLKEYGKYVIGVGIRESASDLLVQNCDEYYSYNALAGLVRTADELPAPRDPWELVAEAVDRMARNGDTMRADRLKQVMQDMDPSFDEKNLGMPKFSRFVSEAAHRGLLTLTRLESGQYEIAPARPAGARDRGRDGGRDLPRDTGRDAGRGSPRDAARDFARDLAARDTARDTTRDAARDRAETFDATDADLTDREVDDGTDEEPAAEQPSRADRFDRGRGRRRGRGRGGRDSDRATTGEFAVPADDLVAADRPPAEPRDVTPIPIVPTIGVQGERLTRAEAFDLVRRGVEALTAGDDDRAGVQELREQVFALLGRDSESLSERMFPRIVQDAADNGVVRTFRDGDAMTVGRVPRPAPNVGDELSRAAAVTQAAPAPVAPAPSAPAAPRGMGPRGVARGRGGRLGAPPPELLFIGAVPPGGGPTTANAPVASPAVDTLPVDTAPPNVAPVDAGRVAAVTTASDEGASAPAPVSPTAAAPTDDAPAVSIESADAADAASSDDAGVAAQPAARSRNRRSRGRGRGAARGGAPATDAPAEPEAAAPAPTATEAVAPQPAADDTAAPARGRGARKAAAKAPAKTAAKRGARKRAPGTAARGTDQGA